MIFFYFIFVIFFLLISSHPPPPPPSPSSSPFSPPPPPPPTPPSPSSSSFSSPSVLVFFFGHSQNLFVILLMFLSPSLPFISLLVISSLGVHRNILAGLQCVAGAVIAGCLTSQQHASVFQGWICSVNCACCHTEIEAADIKHSISSSHSHRANQS